ncbi:MAG: hypothetical protein K8U03_09125 [Planctomycetia bacterium]|nr:hypothetical protein [Planctomycetia bacterium]
MWKKRGLCLPAPRPLSLSIRRNDPKRRRRNQRRRTPWARDRRRRLLAP